MQGRLDLLIICVRNFLSRLIESLNYLKADKTGPRIDKRVLLTLDLLLRVDLIEETVANLLGLIQVCWVIMIY